MKLAADAIPPGETGERNLGLLAVASDDLPTGRYTFFIYELTITSIEARKELATVVLQEDGVPRRDLAVSLLSLVSTSTQWGGEPPIELLSSWEQSAALADDEFAVVRQRVERDVHTRSNSLVGVRIAALQKTYSAKIARLQKWRDEAQSANIRRMRAGQIVNVNAERDRKLHELEGHRAVAVGGKLLLQGVMRVKPLSDDMPVRP